MKTLVIGLGNPILGDDGVGWQVVEKVRDQIGESEAVSFDFLSVGGIGLMEHLVGYQRAIIVDAIVTHRDPIGTVTISKLEDLPDLSAEHMTSVHDTSLQTALRLGRSMGAELPQSITVVGIESQNVYDFSESLSPAVAAAIPSAIQAVVRAIGPSSTRIFSSKED